MTRLTGTSIRKLDIVVCCSLSTRSEVCQERGTSLSREGEQGWGRPSELQYIARVLAEAFPMRSVRDDIAVCRGLRSTPTIIPHFDTMIPLTLFSQKRRLSDRSNLASFRYPLPSALQLSSLVADFITLNVCMGLDYGCAVIQFLNFYIP
jgi:hypothetical protein